MSDEITRDDLVKIDDCIYEIPRNYRSDMKVPARVFASETMLEDIVHDKSLWQLANVATLPGIVKYAMAMPDIHQGYGFPIGGVAATRIDQGGVISPGGIGYDINCGVRLLVSNITVEEIKPHLDRLATEIFNAIPSGVGKGGTLELSMNELDKILKNGAPEMLKKGYGVQSDIDRCEEQGCMSGADPDLVSERAKKRGADQLGTLGSGNHFLEIQHVTEIYDDKVAQAFGLFEGAVVVMIHCGSRGLGHQVCTDYVRAMMSKVSEWGYQLPDKELICAPLNSKEGQDYFAAMQAAANFAWANRHLIAHKTRVAWNKVLGDSVSLNAVYDVSHNMGKREVHMLNDKEVELLVHRKGATRAFPANHPANPAAYRHIGHPVLIPGTMGTSSYVLVGTQEGLETAFGTSCHGAGRKMSRIKAKKTVRGSELRKELEARGIIIRSHSDPGLAEEAPLAYKDVDEVVNVITTTKLARKVVRVKPLAVIKGD